MHYVHCTHCNDSDSVREQQNRRLEHAAELVQEVKHELALARLSGVAHGGEEFPPSYKEKLLEHIEYFLREMRNL